MIVQRILGAVMLLKINFFLYLLAFLFFKIFVTASETELKQIETKRSGFWTYYCKNIEDIRQCEIVRKIIIEQHDETFLIAYKISKDKNSKLRESLNIVTPPNSRIQTKKRLKINFDDKTKFTRSFLECNEETCRVIFKGNKMIKYSMNNFDKMKIIFYVVDDIDFVSFTLPMEGFKEAFYNINQELENY